ncbi:thioesterase domain-containing protein [Alcanivorax sp. S71-1-4]|uniref:thioesterase II family protein n=1 Tax=Alcanivorax sp. S71-1-4 TaxID=1177159 RepID=UPI00135912D6|nr:alpha/beta fold hydrolase [Alcanivorax sp. S71-1-4]KAF0809381.1 thioesterase domain-containing protein [Alcanivorax sp. S71-1-4]
MSHVPVTLLCLPCAGASATMYLRWRRHLPSTVRVVPVELPGRGIRLHEAFVEDFSQLAAQLGDEQRAAMQGRYALFGHSMGALLAFALAQWQQAAGLPLPGALFVSGSPAPQCREREISGQEDDAALIRALHKHGGTPAEVFASDELLRMTLNTLRADYRVCASFPEQPVSPLPVPLQVLAGRRDDIREASQRAWREHTREDFSLHWFDGDHFFIREQEAAVLACLNDALAQHFPEVAHAAVAAS